MCQFFLHSGGGGLEEEGDEEFVGTFGTDLAECIDVCRTVCHIDDDHRMTCVEKDPIGKETSGAAVAVAERMEVLEEAVETSGDDDRMGVAAECCGGGFHQGWDSGYEHFVIAKDGVAGSRVFMGVFSGNGTGNAIGKCVLRHQPVGLTKQLLVKGCVEVRRDILKGPEMVCHFGTFQQRVAYGNHGQTLFLQDSGVVHREGIAFDAARMGGEQHLVPVHVVGWCHSRLDLRFVFVSYDFVSLNFLLKHALSLFSRCKSR